MDEDDSSFEQALNYIRSLGFKIPHPYDESLQEGNEQCGALKPYGIEDLDCEEFYHKPYPTFPCHIPGCESVFDTVQAYESHYKSCHTYTCQECRRNLPNPHLLDLHISETHDFFFLELAKTKPMFRCFSEECGECFKDPAERRNHCITVHKYPSDFRYDALRRKKCVRKKRKPKVAKAEGQQEDQSPKQERVGVDAGDSDTDPEIRTTNKPWKYRNFSFGHSNQRRGRKPVFVNFSNDLLKSLPDV